MRQRTSRTAVLSALLAVALPGIAVITVAGVLAFGIVPVLGILCVFLAIPAAAVAFLAGAIFVFGLASAAMTRIRSNPGLTGAGYASFAKSVSGLGATAALVLLVAYVSVPCLVLWSESSAWRTTAKLTSASLDHSATLIADAAGNLDDAVRNIPLVGSDSRDVAANLQLESHALGQVSAGIAAMKRESATLATSQSGLGTLLANVLPKGNTATAAAATP